MVCDKVCLTKVCVTKCVRKMVCDKDGVCEEAGGGRRREGGAPGIQNQKQEPHTKLWGTMPTAVAMQNRFPTPSWHNVFGMLFQPWALAISPVHGSSAT